jgi:hypothetical protein
LLSVENSESSLAQMKAYTMTCLFVLSTFLLSL